MDIALLHASWYPQTGGGITHVEQLARGLTRRFDCNVDIVTKSTNHNDEFQLPPKANLIQIPNTNTQWRPWNEILYLLGTFKLVWKKDYDIVHGHTNSAAFALQIIRLIRDSQTILTVHGASPDFSVSHTGAHRDILYSIIRKLILRNFQYDGVIGVSEELTDSLSHHHERVTFIANGIDPRKFPAARNFGNKDLLMVGRFRPRKNHMDLIEAMSYVREKHPNVFLHLAGEGPLRQKIESEVKHRHLEDNILIHGYVEEEELIELYKKCPIFVLPSEWEGHPLVLLEAWASGQAVIGTEVTGIREFIKNGPGELVPLHRPKELANSITYLLSNPADVQEIGAEAQEYVRKKYSWDSTIGETFKFYKNLVE